MITKKIMIIDGNSILNRAFYGTDILTTPKGMYTNAVLGFLNIMLKHINEEDPGSMCVAFDLKAPTFRHKEYSLYKGQRKGMPQELADQLPLVKEILDAMRIRRMEVPGYEADDIIGSVANWAKNSGYDDIVIITGDKDALQLVNKKVRVKLLRSKMGKPIVDEYNLDKIRDIYELEPKQLIEVKGLMGDTSDNIPGVKGIGEKNALALIREFGNIDNMYINIDKVKQQRIRQNLIIDRELAMLSRRLGTIFEYLDVASEDADFSVKEYDRPRLYKILEELKFNSMIERLGLRDESYKLNKVERKIKDITKEGDLEKLVKSIQKEGKVYFYYEMDDKTKLEKDLSCFVVAMNDVFYNIDFESISSSTFLSLFSCIFRSTKVEKYTHSAKDLYLFLFVHNIDLNNLKFDSSLAAYILDSCMKKFDLPVVADRFLDIVLPVVEQGEEKNEAVFVEYAAMVKDMAIALDKQLRDNNQDKLYYEVELPLTKVLASLEYWGFKIDKKQLQSMDKFLDKEIKKISQEVYIIAGEEFNLNSPKQVGNILGDKLKLPLKKGKQSYSTDIESLLPLKDENKIVGLIIEYRKLSKLKSTYTDGIMEKIDSSDGKVHSTFNQMATVTGRISSTEPNLQNIPIKSEVGKRIRKIFVPYSKEFVFLDADYSQIELRVLAHITKDESLIKSFLNGEDIHRATASKVFKVSEEDVTQKLRSRAKTINFGIVYGMGEHNLSKDLGISTSEAKEYIETYFKTHPKVKEYSDETIEKGKELGYVSTIFGRTRPLPELKSKNRRVYTAGKRAAINAPIQGSAADIIKIAMIKVYDELKKRNMKSRLILQVHDELLIETHINEVEEVRYLLKECMENAVQLDVPLTVEVKEGSSWFEAK
ncbi:MAG: DNA polymerase I [Clostridiales bacterium]|nr:DNA polymerase I [Clostridiales bacterium]